ncbi:MAG: polysaccharide deacetylase family protein [Clostridia bacterium]|nr:polysaccharide deacetylase family protein [Clostridia bacterium]
MYRFLRFPEWKYKAVTLSYDDGVIFDKKLIEILDKYGLKCTFNLNSELYASKTGGRRLTKSEATALYKNSHHEVAIHGAKHFSLAEISTEAMLREIMTDRENLERQFGRIIKGMAYANGSFSDEVVEVLKTCKIKYARTIISTHAFDIPSDWLRLCPTCHHSDKDLYKLTDKFLTYNVSDNFWSNPPRLFYLWGHSFEFNDHNDWETIENFAKKVGNRDDVWYCTNGEVYDYVKAFEKLEYSVNGETIYNGTDKDVYICYYGKNVLVKAGKVLKIK